MYFVIEEDVEEEKKKKKKYKYSNFCSNRIKHVMTCVLLKNRFFTFTRLFTTVVKSLQNFKTKLVLQR